MTDAEVGSIVAAIVGAGGTVGTLVSRAIRWAARVHRATVEASQEIIRDNTQALREFATALGRVDGNVQAVARERSGVYDAAPMEPDPPAREVTTRDEDTPPMRRYPRAQSSPKRGP